MEGLIGICRGANTEKLIVNEFQANYKNNSDAFNGKQPVTLVLRLFLKPVDKQDVVKNVIKLVLLDNDL